MDTGNNSAETLRNQIADAERQVRKLKERLADVESRGKAEEQNSQPDEEGEASKKWPLTAEEYTRYGRQMIVPTIGIEGQ
jgi:adenylyltransferase and sulfurtransferase